MTTTLDELKAATERFFATSSKANAGELNGGLIALVGSVLARRIDALERRVGQVEESGIKYAGTYQRAAEYRRGDTVTHAGSMWVALKASPSGIEPGSDKELWQLAAKKGRDGRATR